MDYERNSNVNLNSPNPNHNPNRNTTTTASPEVPAGNPMTAVLGIIGGAVIGAVLYFIISRLGRFSFWAAGLGAYLSMRFYLSQLKRRSIPLTLLTIILNIAAITLADVLNVATWLSREYAVGFGEALDVTIQGLFFYDGIAWSDLRYVIISAVIIVGVGLFMHFKGLDTLNNPGRKRQAGRFGQNPGPETPFDPGTAPETVNNYEPVEDYNVDHDFESEVNHRFDDVEPVDPNYTDTVNPSYTDTDPANLNYTDPPTAPAEPPEGEAERPSDNRFDPW